MRLAHSSPETLSARALGCFLLGLLMVQTCRLLLLLLAFLRFSSGRRFSELRSVICDSSDDDDDDDADEDAEQQWRRTARAISGPSQQCHTVSVMMMMLRGRHAAFARIKPKVPQHGRRIQKPSNLSRSIARLHLPRATTHKILHTEKWITFY